jgi:hypothetical protein
VALELLDFFRALSYHKSDKCCGNDCRKRASGRRIMELLHLFLWSGFFKVFKCGRKKVVTIELVFSIFGSISVLLFPGDAKLAHHPLED